ETSKLANRSLASLKLKQNILIAAIIRNNKTIFPTGEDVLTVGDRIVVITLLKNITRTSDMLAR
ncbi:TPA: Trk system potassium transport protein TrkA, partial [Streptococcus agalactiae]|nr:Trk system potassium transport protein TrkA [Streptococcus agalactiae]